MAPKGLGARSLRGAGDNDGVGRASTGASASSRGRGRGRGRGLAPGAGQRQPHVQPLSQSQPLLSQPQRQRPRSPTEQVHQQQRQRQQQLDEETDPFLTQTPPLTQSPTMSPPELQCPTTPQASMKSMNKSPTKVTPSATATTNPSPGVVNDGDFLVTPEYRKALRERLVAGEHMSRKHKIKPAEKAIRPPLTAQDKKTFEPRLDRIIRWNTMLLHTNLNATDLIRHVFGERIDVDSQDWDWARNKILENHRSYKSKTMQLVKQLVERLIEQDSTLMELSSTSFLGKMQEKFNQTNYFSCFPFMKFYLGFEQTSEYGKWYLKQIFSNLVCRVRDWKKNNSHGDSWTKVLEYWDEIALLDVYDGVDLNDFQELSHKYRKAREPKKRDLQSTSSSHFMLAPPPKKLKAAPKPIDNPADLDDEEPVRGSAFAEEYGHGHEGDGEEQRDNDDGDGEEQSDNGDDLKNNNDGYLSEGNDWSGTAEGEWRWQERV